MSRTGPENTVAELLYRLAQHAETEPSFARDPVASDQAAGPRRIWTMGMAAALVVVVTLASASLLWRRDSERPVTIGGEPTALPHGATERLAAAGLTGRSGASSVWTGKELLVWGGSTLVTSENRWLADGAALDPVANRWRPLPPAPIGPRSEAATVWTGSEMVVWGGTANSQMLTDGAAFNPETHRWRVIASQSSAGGIRPAAVWTGTEMLVMSSANAALGTSAYNPRTDRWRRLAPPPGALVMPYPQVAWTGSEAVLVLSPSGPTGSAGPGSRGSDTASPAPTVVRRSDPGASTAMPAPPGPPPPEPPRLPSAGGPNSNMFLASFSPDSNEWSRLPALDMKDGSLPRLVWTGREVLVLQSALPSAAFDPEQQTWRALQPVPDDASSFAHTAVWTGHLALLWSGGKQGLAFDPEADAWWTFDAGGLRSRSGAVVAWADGLFVGWGGFSNHAHGSGRLEKDGIRYRPPSR